MYKSQATETFKAGINEPYRSYLTIQKPVTLDLCIQECRTYDNQETQTAFMNFLKSRERVSSTPQIQRQIPQFKF